MQKRIAVRECVQVPNDVLAGANGDIEKFLVLEMIVSIQKRVTD